MSKSAHRTDTGKGVPSKTAAPEKTSKPADEAGVKATPTPAAPAASTPKSDEVDIKECLKRLTELSIDFKMRLDEHEERIKFLEKWAAKSEAAKPESTKPGATKAGGALKGDSKPTEGEPDKGFASIFAAFGKADTPTGDPKPTKAEPTSATPKAEPTKATPTGPATKAAPAGPATKAAPAGPATKATPAEPTPKATKPDPVPVIVADTTAGPGKSGPGYGFKYWDARTRTWGLTPDIWKARQLSNGVYQPIWVWYDAKGGIDHILSSSELEKYVP